MLNNDLIILTEEIKDFENQIVAKFRINIKCKVFKGHFPNHPIVPGVLEAQIIENILFEKLCLTGQIISASNIKFSTPIYPDNEEKEYTCLIKYKYKSNSIIDSKAKIINNDNTTFMVSSCQYLIQ